MKHRIRAAGLLVSGDKLLLALEKIEATGKEFWIPPGGGLEAEDGSVTGCVRREFLEETGLSVKVGSLIYIREFAKTSRETHHLEMFFRVHQTDGHLHQMDQNDPPMGSDLKRYVRWFTQEELQTVDVAPRELRDTFWTEMLAGLSQARYLGVSIE